MSGASGFIGRSLTASLQAHGHEVVSATHRPPSPGEVGIDVGRRRLDMSRLDRVGLVDVDAVVHLAGAPLLGRLTARRRELVRSSRITTGEVLARAMAAMEPRPSVYVTQSAVGYYGDTGEAEVDETFASGQGFLASVCRAWEQAASPAADAGIRVVALRTGIVLGFGGGALRPQIPLFRLGLGGRLGSGRQYMSWITLEDEVRAISHALFEGALDGPVNATAPEPVRNDEFTRTLARALGKSAPLKVPQLLLRIALGEGAANEMLLSSQKVLPRRLVESGFEFRHPTLEDALTAILGSRPKTHSPTGA